MSIFIHVCIECQQNNHINQKIETAAIQAFSDTKPPSKQNAYIHVIVDAFSHFVVTIPGKQNNAQTLSIPYYIIGLPNLDLLYI